MKLVTFNVNGIRAIIKKDFINDFNNIDADIFAIQETKYSETNHEDFPFHPDNYYIYWTNSKIKKGYSGVAIFSKIKPLSVYYGLKDNRYDEEGRVLTLEFKDYYFVAAYVPNAGENLKRLDFRMEYEEKLREYLLYLDKTKPIIYCGDLNVAHNEIDLKNPKTNTNNPGFTKEEREKMTLLLDVGFIDCFRYLYPDKIAYSWWSYRFKAREKNIGWRIDYFITSSRIKDKINDCKILDSVYGSDHCPVLLEINL